ncbi:MAG: histidine kinase [Spirochaetia bacterium]|nr:histidine kinase [Spirochaetia bacterium]
MKKKNIISKIKKKIQADIHEELITKEYPSSKILIPFVFLSVFIGEFIVESNLDKIIVIDKKFAAVIDSVILSFIVFPAVYFAVYRPLIKKIRKNISIADSLKKDKIKLNEKIKYNAERLRVSNADLKRKIREHEIDKRSLKKVKEYNEKIISSLSPLAIINRRHKIVFVNEAFNKEFASLSREKDANFDDKKDIFKTLKLRAADKALLSQRFDDEKRHFEKNCELKINKKYYSCTVFQFEAGTGLILSDTTKRKELENEVKKLSAEIINSEEAERERMAKDLHDSVVQTISAAKLSFTSFEKKPVEGGVHYARGQQLLSRANQELREALENLFPSVLTNLGLEAAIHWYSRHNLYLNNIKPKLDIKIKAEIPHDIQVQLYRIFQEVIANILKHSKADRVSVLLKTTGANKVLFQIEDNGIGFSIKEAEKKIKKFGLYSIRRRIEAMNGALNVVSEKNQGTKYDIVVEWHKKNET